MTETHENELELEEDPREDTVVVNYDIASYPSDLTLSVLNEMYTEREILIPSYQRGFVWSIDQASLLIDSFLCGLPVPSVFFYIDENNKNLVIDGQQRIKSIVYFFAGLFGEEDSRGKRDVFRLSGLDHSSPYHKKGFKDLNESDQRKFKQSVLRAVNIRQLKPAGGDNTSAYHIFERLNTGGTELAPQEIRNCVFRGKFNDDLKLANENQSWRKILGASRPDKRQKDVELLLRVFSLFAEGDRYEKPMKEFLNKAMMKHSAGETEEAKNFFGFFAETAEKVSQCLEAKPFHLRRRLNGSALDSVMSVLLKHAQKLDHIDISERYNKLCNDEVFREATQGKTTDTKTVIDRVKRVEEILLG